VIEIGHVKKETVSSVRALVMEVLNTKSGDEAKVAALNCVAKALSCEHITVTNCTFYGDRRKKAAKRTA